MKWLRFPRVLGIVVCLYLVGMSAVFGAVSRQDYQFLHGAARTQGTVVALVPRAPIGSTRDPVDDGRTASLAPQVSYSVGGVSYTYVAAHGRFHQPVHVGDTVTVLYDPQQPSVARIKGEGRVVVPLITTTFVLTALLVAWILFRTRRVGELPPSPGVGRRGSHQATEVDQQVGQQISRQLGRGRGADDPPERPRERV